MERNYYVLYQKYKNKYLSLKYKNSEINQNGGGSDMCKHGMQKSQCKVCGGSEKKDIFLFKADWCGHCKGFFPSWNKLKEEHSSKYNFITYDSEKNKEEIKNWNIEGFPTIIVKKGKDAMEYVGPNEYNSVLSFIENI